MRSEKASIPTRGSRFKGLASMIIVTVCGSEREWEHDTAARASVTAITKDALCIGNLAQDRRTQSSGCRGKITRVAVPGLISKQRKGDGLFGLRRQSEFVAGR